MEHLTLDGAEKKRLLNVVYMLLGGLEVIEVLVRGTLESSYLWLLKVSSKSQFSTLLACWLLL